MINPLVKVLERFYNQGVYTEENLRMFVQNGDITQEEFDKIIKEV